MLDPSNPLLYASQRQKQIYGDNHHQAHFDQALRLFNRVCRKARLAKIWSAIRRRAARLYNLSDFHEQLEGSHYVGLQAVPIRMIRGSECRGDDFDNGFNPLDERLRDRWLGIAMAREEGTALPPVCLILVAGIYFVRDGHHRISVARALGEQVIDAEVVEQKVRGRMPWQASVATELKLERRYSFEEMRNE